VFGSSVQIHRSCPKEGSSWDGILRREAELQLKKRTWDRWGQRSVSCWRSWRNGWGERSI